jgi:hypothetical protein
MKKIDKKQAAKIVAAFYEREKAGNVLSICFEETAKEFGITVDNVVDILNDFCL